MKILVGQLWHESHDFSPVPTRAADFAVEYGADMLTSNADAGSTLGGILRHLTRAGVELVPSLAARARPGGRVEAGVYERFRARILSAAAAAGPLDGVVFELHGAMSAEGYDSPEADLMSRLRDLLGPNAVLAVGLDLHAHVSNGLMTACDIVTACKENPHADVVEAGERAADLALLTIQGKISPATTVIKLPMLLKGGTETCDRPLADLHVMARKAVSDTPGLLDISIFNVQTPRDADDMGQAIVVIADGDTAAADAAALPIARLMWERREHFANDFADMDSALDMVMEQPEHRPFVLGDSGDRVLAGTPGDSVVLLQRLRERNMPLRCVVPVTDPETAAAALAAGPGAVIERNVGGHMTPGFSPLHLRLRVRTTDPVGDFVQKGPYQGGQRSTLGVCAVLEDDRGNLIVATTAAGMTQDPAAFTSRDIEIADYDFLVAKSGNHFKLSFAGLATPLVVTTPGLSEYVPGFFPFSRSRLWPEVPDMELGELILRHFGRRADPDRTVAFAA